MDPAQVWPQVDKTLNYVRSWIMWGIGLVFPIVLAMLMLKGTAVSLFVGNYVPTPGSDPLPWVYMAVIWYAIRK